MALPLLRLLQLVLSSEAASASSTGEASTIPNGSTSQSCSKRHDLDDYALTLLTRSFHKFIQPQGCPSHRLGCLAYALLQAVGREPGRRACLARDVLHATTDEPAAAREGMAAPSGRWTRKPGAGVEERERAAVDEAEAAGEGALWKEARAGAASSEQLVLVRRRTQIGHPFVRFLFKNTGPNRVAIPAAIQTLVEALPALGDDFCT